MSHYNNGGLDLSRTPMFVQITFAHEICREHDEFLSKYRKYLHFLEIDWFLNQDYIAAEGFVTKTGKRS